jgi:nucleoside-diphosphate-sugar epimerase
MQTRSDEEATMRVFVAGATGAIGKPLVPMLVSEGHEVVAMTRSVRKADQLKAGGAIPAVADGLDRRAVVDAVVGAKPEVVIHQLTALTGFRDLKHWDREWAQTNRLRTEGTDHLLEGARAAGTRGFIAQSYAGWPYAREGGAVKTEDEPFDPDPPAQMRPTLEAIRYLEDKVLGAQGLEGTVLRYGSLYGPGTSIALGGDIVETVRARKFPLVDGGSGIWSFIHVEDAASAALACVEPGKAGLYNVVDDEPAPVTQWLPALAQAIGAKPPRRLPVWLARMAIGDVGVSMMTRIRGASNAKARSELGWAPRYATWREGFVSGLTDEPVARRDPGRVR